MRIIVAPETGASDELLARLRSWSGAGLLEPFCWWPTPLDPRADRGAEVTKVVGGELSTVPLSAALGDGEPADARLVAVYAALAEEGFDPRFVDAARARTEAVADVMPFQPGAPVSPVMIAIPGAVGRHVAPELFRSEWAANVLVVPEDRSGPEGANVLADTPGFQPSHAAHSLACLTDLWTMPPGRRSSLIDAVKPRPGSPDPVRVVPVRCYSRIVDLGYLADHLAAAVFRRRETSWPNPDRERFDRVEDPVELLEYATRQYLRKHESVLGLTPFEPIEQPERPKLSILAALRWLWEELVARVKRKPFELAEHMLENIVERAADFVEARAGENRPFDVARWRDDATATNDLSGMREDLKRPFVVPDGAVAETWRDLIHLALGLIDGSPLPDGIDTAAFKLNEKRLVVTDPAQVVPDPARAPAKVDGSEPPRACDPRALRGDEERFDPAVWVAPHAATPLWIVGVEIARSLDEAEALGADPEEGEGPEDDGSAAEEAQGAADEKEPEDARTTRRRSRRRVVRGIAWRFLVALAASVAIWAGLAIALAAVVQVALLLLFFGSLVGLARRVRASRERAAIERVQAELDAVNEELERSLRKGDAQRLKRRYDEYLDWAEVIGWIAHRPWVGEPLRRIDIRNPIDPTTLPAAVKVGIGRPDDRLDLLRQQAERGVFRPEWLSGLYRSVESSLLEDLDLAAGAERGGDHRSPVTDKSGEGYDRRQLREAVREGRYRHLADNELCRELLAFVDGLPIDLATDGIRLLSGEAGEDDEPLPPAIAWFSPPRSLPQLASRLRPAVVRVLVRSPAGAAGGGTGVIVSSAGEIATARHVVEGAEELEVVFEDGSACPATVTRVSTETDLALLQAQASHMPAHVVLSGEELTQGDPVVCLGHPLLQRGEATLAWGLVAASDRRIRCQGVLPGIAELSVFQATYQSAAGASGSPVFDLEGRLVGIHSMGSVDQEREPKARYLSSAVPAAHLRQLMAGADGQAAGETAGEPPEATDGRGPRGAAAKRPTEFLAELVDLPAKISFLRDYWVDPTRGRALVERSMPEAPELSSKEARIASLAGTTEFLRPIRVSLHRVELAHPVSPSALACCTEKPAP